MMGEQVGENLLAGHGDTADFLDFESPGDVREAGEVFGIDSRGRANADHRQHHVAGSGDVVNVPLASR